MRAIFSKTTLVLLIMLFMVLWLSGGLLNRLVHLPNQLEKKTSDANPSPEQTTQADNAPAFVQVIMNSAEPIAAEMRASVSQWWQVQKVHISSQVSQWFDQQQKLLVNIIKTKFQDWLSKTLGVAQPPAQ